MTGEHQRAGVASHETESYEEKSHFDFVHGQQFSIVKTIVAFANTKGGRLVFKSYTCDAQKLDSARLDDLVNRFVQPRVGGISSTVHEDDSCEVVVEKSSQAPHVFFVYQSYVDEKGKDRSAWQVGQIPVRHSSKTKEALAEDIQRIISARVQDILSAVGKSIERLGARLSEDTTGLPIRLVSAPDSLEFGFPDINTTHPFTPSQAGKQIGKSGPWFGQAIKSLGLRSNPNYCFELGSGPNTVRRYSDLAVEAVRARIKDEPLYSPY